MAQLFDASRTWEIRDPYPLQAGDREPAITLPSLQVVPGAPDPIPKAFVPPFFSVQPLSRVGPFPTPWIVAPQLLCPWDSPGKDTRVCYHFLLQRIFLIQGLNLSLLRLLHFRPDSFTAEPLGKPKVGGHWSTACKAGYSPACFFCLIVWPEGS